MRTRWYCGCASRCTSTLLSSSRCHSGINSQVRFSRLNNSDARRGEHIALVMADVDNHGQCGGQHLDKGFGARLTYRFRLDGNINHTGFSGSVNVG